MFLVVFAATRVVLHPPRYGKRSGDLPPQLLNLRTPQNDRVYRYVDEVDTVQLKWRLLHEIKNDVRPPIPTHPMPATISRSIRPFFRPSSTMTSSEYPEPRHSHEYLSRRVAHLSSSESDPSSLRLLRHTLISRLLRYSNSKTRTGPL